MQPDGGFEIFIPSDAAFQIGFVLELEVCRVRFARVSCPRLRFCAAQ